MVRKLVMILFLSLTNSVNNPKLNSNIYVRLEIVLFFTPFWEWIQILFATIIRKLSKILNLRLSGGANIQIYIHIQGFQKRVYEKGFVGRFPKVLFICVYLYISLLNWFHDSSPEREGGWSPSSIRSRTRTPQPPQNSIVQFILPKFAH